MYSHAAFAVKDVSGQGYSGFHDLNRYGGDASQLFEQGLAEFYMNAVVDNEVALAIPEPGLLDRLAELFSSQTERLRMHETSHSAVACSFCPGIRIRTDG